MKHPKTFSLKFTEAAEAYRGAPSQLAAGMFLDELFSASSNAPSYDRLTLELMDHFNTGRTTAANLLDGWLKSFPRTYLHRPADLRRGFRR